MFMALVAGLLGMVMLDNISTMGPQLALLVDTVHQMMVTAIDATEKFFSEYLVGSGGAMAGSAERMYVAMQQQLL